MSSAIHSPTPGMRIRWNPPRIEAPNCQQSLHMDRPDRQQILSFFTRPPGRQWVTHCYLYQSYVGMKIASFSRLTPPSGEQVVDSWLPDEGKAKIIDSALEEEKEEIRPPFSANCAKCNRYTAEDPELRGWWPAINAKLCDESSYPTVYPNEVLTWYCKQCYIEQSSNILLRVLRKLFT
jgi:hypothetical protein